MVQEPVRVPGQEEPVQVPELAPLEAEPLTGWKLQQVLVSVLVQEQESVLVPARWEGARGSQLCSLPRRGLERRR